MEGLGIAARFVFVEQSGGVGVRRAEGTHTAQRGERQIGPGPGCGLDPEGEVGFEEERVAQQRGEGADVRERVEPIRRAPLELSCEPGLHQRAGRGEQQVGHAHRRREQEQDVQRGILGAGRLPRLRRSDRQEVDGCREQRHVYHDLLARLQFLGQ